MDDPWGSPWALPETASKNDPPTPSPPKSLLSPPPRAFFGSTSNLQSQSPWATEDGFGGWTDTEQTDITANAIDWGVWAEPSSLIPQPSPRGSIALPTSAATSPGLRPLPRSRTSSVFRHHSPDPWATEVSLQDKKDDPLAPADAPESSGLGIQHELVETPASSAQVQDAEANSVVNVDDRGLKEGAGKIQDNGSRAQELASLRPDDQESHSPADPGFDSAPKFAIHDAVSRPSSALSLNSSIGADRQESPITSIDEDPKSRVNTTSRKLSGKVQELVGMYDGLARSITRKSSSSTLLEPGGKEGRGRSSSRTRSNAAEDDVDFGDFEDAQSEYDRPAALKPDTSLPFPSRPSTPADQDKDISIQGQVKESPGREAQTSATPLRSAQQFVEEFGPVKFDIDFQSVDKLFPSLSQELNEDENTREISEVPDRIITDSFTTISERKTWYRISRYGSMRKHDLGDDDNYHRVEWSTSCLHNDVIKIVRRWMEVDSISGRATLGAGKRTSVFNWDSSAAPVDLGKVFARKASTPHLRNTSLPIPNQEPSSTVPIKSPIQPPEEVPKQRPASIPSFGWSSNTKRSPSTAHPTPSKGETTPTTITVEAGVDTIQTQIEVTKEDDDEWGEMVSSPRVETQPDPIAATLSPLNESGFASLSISPSSRDPKIVAKNVVDAHSSSSTSDLSISIPQSSQTLTQAPDQTTSPTTKTPRVDSWPPIDFSIFDTPPARTPKSPRQDHWPLTDFALFESPTSISTSTRTARPKTVSKLSSKSRKDNNPPISIDEVVEAKTPLKSVLGPIEKSGHEQDQDNIVKSIVQNLPDLSYMLR